MLASLVLVLCGNSAVLLCQTRKFPQIFPYLINQIIERQATNNVFLILLLQSRSVTTAISDVIMWRRCSVALLIVYVVIVIDQVRTESNNDENVYYWYDLCLFLRILFLYVVHQYLTELRKITATATSDTYQVPPVTFSGMQTAC